MQFYVFCSNTDLGEEPIADINPGAWTKYNEHTFIWYAAKENRSQILLSEAEKIKPDVIFSVGIFSWHFNIVPMLFCKAPRKYLSVRGMLHDGALSQKKIKKQLYLKTLGFFDFHRKFIFHATDEKEKFFIEKQFGEEAITVIAANFPRKFKRQSITKEKGTIHFCSIGIISPMKNYELVLGALQSAKDVIHYDICGAIKDQIYWAECQRLIKKLPENVTVVFHGEIKPEDVEEKLRNSHVFILPSKSENFGHAIFEALTAGRPVITSKNTPWNELRDFNAGINTDLNSKDVADAISFFAVMNDATYQNWSEGATRFADNALDTERIKGQYDVLFK